MVLTVRRLKMEAWQFYTNTNINKIKLMPDQQQQQSQYQQRIAKQKPKHQQPQQQQEIQHQEDNVDERLEHYLQEYQHQQQQRQELNQRLQQHQPQPEYQQLREKIPQRPHAAENHIFITNVNQNCLTASSLVSKQNQKTISATNSTDCCPISAAIPTAPPLTAKTTTATGPTTTPRTTATLIPAQSTVCQPKCKQITSETVASLLVMCHHQQQYQQQQHHHHQYQRHHHHHLHLQQQHQQHSQYQTENLLNLKQYPQQRPQKHYLLVQQHQQQKIHHHHQVAEKEQQQEHTQHCQEDYLPSLYSENSYSIKSKNLRKSLYSVMEHLLVIVSLLIALSAHVAGDESQDFQKNIPARLVWAAVGKSVDLPCDLTPPGQDSVKLLLWFKDTTGIPLYSLDSRGGNVKLATHSAIASDLGQRLFFSIGDNPKDSRLQIRDVKPTDGGVYRCRIDYFNFPTRNYRINLTLVVPPEEPRIFDAQGNEIAQAGPFREGYEMFLCCQVKGGRPPPKVTWWMGDTELIGTSHTSTEEGATVIVNQLLIGTTPRDYYGEKIQCRAQGTKLIEPVTKEVALQVYLKPLKVKIVTPNDLLTAGHPVPIRCETTGSHPPAKITWLLDGEPIRNPEVTVREDSNKTTSILTLKVTSENDNAELTCRATNLRFSGGAIEDKRVIRVAYPPTVSVHLANEDPSRVVTRAEGQNVTFKCRADARPPVTSYSWFKNGMRMSGESSEIMHLTQLERESAGAYACGATNTEGETRSSSITLRVQYSPRCKPGTEQTSIGAINMHSIPVKCEVDADPPDSVKFSWTYNNTRNVSPVLNSRIQSNGLVSTVTYLPQTDSELITLACWASNAVGRQTTPCLVHILPANPPEAPRSCELRNDTVLEVVCVAGSDGGLSQYFVLEVVGGDPLFGVNDATRSFNDANPGENEISTMNDQATSAPIFRMQEPNPQFRLNNLEPGREYQFLVYAVNAKGRSDPPVVIERVRVAAQLGPYDESILSEDPTPAETTHHVSGNVGVAASGAGASIGGGPEKQSTLLLLAAVVAIGAVIVTSIIVAGIVVVCKHRPRAPQPQDVRKSMRPARNDVPSMYIEEEELNDEEAAMGTARSAEIRARIAPINMMPRCSTSTASSQHHYISEGFIQYAQPSLNVYITDPDLILPRGELEFTTLDPTLK
ncbi:motor axon guidance molcule sidestep isoform X4 [Musca autumnalis]|uniref:motor axon guidance molcule sidestep isoform X4 n=1 Tax=Musca autumnalis TaxID=221902 RepID=UPI003CF63977